MVPDVSAYTAVIHVCAHACNVERAVDWFTAMQEAGIWFYTKTDLNS